MKSFLLKTILLSLVIIVSCKKNTEPDPGPPTADILGAVSLYDEGGTSIDNSGMKVSIAGVEQLFSTTTNSDGEYVLNDVSLGTYSLVFEKSGFGTYKIFDIELPTADVPVNIPNIPSLGQVSTTEIIALAVNVTGDDVIIAITSNPGGTTNNSKYVRYFFNDLGGVSVSSYAAFTEGIKISNSPHVKTFTKADLIAMGFTSGATIHVKAYGDSFYSNDYDEPSLGIRLFPNLNLNSADELSFILP